MIFLCKLANRDISWLDEIVEGTDTEVGNQIVQNNLSLAKSIYALVSHDFKALKEHMNEISEQLDGDAKMVNILVLITNSALETDS